MHAIITERPDGLYVEVTADADRYWRKPARYRRVSGVWQCLSDKGKWFDCNIHFPEVQRQVEDYEFCLRPYGADEGPAYPRVNKKGNVGTFFRALQAKELDAATKRIFAPVKLKYDAHAENMARFNREVATQMRAPLARKYLTGNFCR